MFNVQWLMPARTTVQSGGVNGNTLNINPQPLTIGIYNVLGEKIYSLSPFGGLPAGLAGGAVGGLHLDLSDKPNGIYFLKVETKNGTRTGRLAVIK